jgi:cyclic pyranopterin phosphate synthase
VIASVSQPFCGSCDRIRITADGKFRTCLFATSETDLKTPLRAGAGDQELARIIADAVANKAAGHLINQPGFEKPARFMYAIGG